MSIGSETAEQMTREAIQISEAAVKLAALGNCPYLRMDTNAKNQAARKLYARLGYWEADIVPCVFNGIPGVQLVCLEKTV